MSQDTHVFLDMYENITPDTCTVLVLHFMVNIIFILRCQTIRWLYEKTNRIPANPGPSKQNTINVF